MLDPLTLPALPALPAPLIVSDTLDPITSPDPKALPQTFVDKTQQRAVEHVDGPAIVFAGPGTGKTRILTARIVRL